MPQKPPAISRTQLIGTASLSMLAASLRIVSAYCSGAAGRAGWLCAPVSLPFAVGASLLISALLRRRRPGEGLASMLRRALGRTAGGIVCGIFSVWFIALAGLLLASGASRMTGTIYTSAEPWGFIAVMLAAALLAALGGVRAVARSAEIFRPVMWAALLAVLLFAALDSDFKNLLPVTGRDALPVLSDYASGVSAFAAVLAGVAFLEGAAPVEPGRGRSFALWCCAPAALLCALCAVIIGRFGAELASRFTYPFFLLVRNVSFFGSSVRLEALITVLWVIPDFIFISMLLRAGVTGLRTALCFPDAESERLTDMKNGRWLIPLCTAAAGVVGFLTVGNAFELRDLTERLAPWVGVGMVFGLLPVALIIGRIRKTT